MDVIGKLTTKTDKVRFVAGVAAVNPEYVKGLLSPNGTAANESFEGGLKVLGIAEDGVGMSALIPKNTDP